MQVLFYHLPKIMHVAICNTWHYAAFIFLPNVGARLLRGQKFLGQLPEITSLTSKTLESDTESNTARLLFCTATVFLWGERKAYLAREREKRESSLECVHCVHVVLCAVLCCNVLSKRTRDKDYC